MHTLISELLEKVTVRLISVFGLFVCLFLSFSCVAADVVAADVVAENMRVEQEELADSLPIAIQGYSVVSYFTWA